MKWISYAFLGRCPAAAGLISAAPSALPALREAEMSHALGAVASVPFSTDGAIKF
jgi:hypothetical protein